VIIVRTMNVCMMAVELKWWRAGFVKVTDGAWSRASEEDYRLKGWVTPCMQMVSFHDLSKLQTVGSMLRDGRAP
jgi:hypothetical protein